MTPERLRHAAKVAGLQYSIDGACIVKWIHGGLNDWAYLAPSSPALIAYVAELLVAMVREHTHIEMDPLAPAEQRIEAALAVLKGET